MADGVKIIRTGHVIQWQPVLLDDPAGATISFQEEPPDGVAEHIVLLPKRPLRGH